MYLVLTVCLFAIRTGGDSADVRNRRRLLYDGHNKWALTVCPPLPFLQCVEIRSTPRLVPLSAASSNMVRYLAKGMTADDVCCTGSLPIAGYYASQTARSACIERFTELDTPYARHFRAFALNDQSVSDPMYEEINDGSSAVEDELKLWQERNGVVAYDHRKDIYLVKSENSAQALAEQEQLQQTQAQQQQQQQAQQNSSDKNFITFEDLRQRAMAEDARKRAAQQAAAEEKAAKIRARKQKSSDGDDEVDGAPTGGQKKGTTWSEIRKHVSEYGIESSPS